MKEEKQIEGEKKTGIRLNKYVANAGISSRRKADELIKKGYVMVNDKKVLEMGFRVQSDDVVKYQGKVIKREQNKVYILMNKPKNTITTVSDPQGRKTVMDLVANVCRERVYPVGRLDRATTGLLLLTNDGDLAKKLSHPSHNVKKTYVATLDKALAKKDLEKIKKGLILEDGSVEVDAIQYKKDGKKQEIVVELHLGRNRIVRRIFEHLGYEVKKLDRVYYAGLTKQNVPRGRFRFLTKQEVIMLRHFV